MDTSLIKQKEASGLVCVTLDVHLWSGRKRLRKEKLLEKNPEFANLPPESLATLGSIKIADPDDLAPFMRIKREAEKQLLLHGLPLLGTVGIPEAKLSSVYKKLTLLQSEFEGFRTQLHAEYESRLQEWRDKDENRGWAHLIHDIPTPEYVAGRLAFGFHLCRVSAPSADDSSPINDHYGKQVGGLKGELFADAAREARLLMDKYLCGNVAGVTKTRDRITQKTIGPLRRVAEKLRSFSFLDPSVGPMAAVVEHCLSLLPHEGPIDGAHLVHIWALARTLANESAAEEAAAIALQLSSPSMAFESLLTKAADTVPSPVVAAAQPAAAGPADSELAADAADTTETAEQAPLAVESFAPTLTAALF